jgi:N-acyl-L-homoserine lactone synthetase
VIGWGLFARSFGKQQIVLVGMNRILRYALWLLEIVQRKKNGDCSRAIAACHDAAKASHCRLLRRQNPTATLLFQLKKASKIIQSGSIH